MTSTERSPLATGGRRGGGSPVEGGRLDQDGDGTSRRAYSGWASGYARGVGPRIVLAALIVSACNPSGSASPVATTADSGAPATVSASASASAPPPATATAPDASAFTIDALVARLDPHAWVNGGYPKITLPESATTRDVLEQSFARSSFTEGRVTRFDILEERDVKVGGTPLHAARLDTDRGPVIVLMRYQPTGWWTRSYQPSVLAP